jgi:hypothetical protein
MVFGNPLPIMKTKAYEDARFLFSKISAIDLSVNPLQL